MDSDTSWLKERYPRMTQLEDGSAVQLLLMTAAYAKEVHGFTTALPPGDLLYLRDDITDPKVINEWVRNISRGETVSLLARMDGPHGRLAGFLSIHRTRSRWTRGVGELRVNVAEAHRGSGLGRVLTHEAIEIAPHLALRKLTGQMTAEQDTAKKIFEHLGFMQEARLRSWVEDRNGEPHDLLIMSRDV